MTLFITGKTVSNYLIALNYYCDRCFVVSTKVAIGDDVGNIAHGANKHEFISQLGKNELPLSLY
jgi:hypothetical protein